MDKNREAFEQYIRSQSGFTADFKIGCNGQYKSDLMHFIFITWQEQQKRIDELQARVDAVKGLAQALWEKSNDKHNQGKVWESKALGECADEILDVLEQALKGGEV